MARDDPRGRMKRMLERMRRIRADWKREGYCTRCGKFRPEPGYTRCATCCDLDRLRIRKRPLDNASKSAHP